MSREELLELIVELERERLKLVRRAERAEKRADMWYKLYLEKGDIDNDL